MGKWSNTTTESLVLLAKQAFTTFERFIAEYLESGVLWKPSKPVQAVAAVTPTNNDAAERAFGMYDYLNSSVAVNMRTAVKLKEIDNARLARDDRQRRIHAEKISKTNCRVYYCK